MLATFEMLGARLLLDTEDHAAVRWLEGFFRPWFSPVEPAACTHTVRLVRDEARHAELEAARAGARPSPVACFTLDSDVIELPAWPAGDATCVADPGLGCFYLMTGAVTTVVARPGGTGPRLAVMRLLRELASASLSSPMRPGLHAAAVELGGRAVVLAGPKGSGKTTLLLHLILAGRGGLIANDWTLASCAGPPVAHGMPTVVKVRPTSLGLLPLDTDRLEDRSFLLLPGEEAAQAAPVRDARYLCGWQLAAWLGTRAVASAPIAAVVFPRIVAEAEALSLVHLDAASALERLRACLHGHGRRGATVFGGARAEAEPGLANLARSVPVFEYALGRDAYRGDAALRTLLEALPGR
jgi:hypothetical protein